jgi:thioester reductase-like protein
MSSTTFVTGFPGFIGRRLVARLLADDPERRIVALVEERMAAAARDVAAGIAGGERIELEAGDISQRRLGLDDPTWDRLTATVTHVFHLAAIYDLAVPIEIAQRVNVDGTGNVLELCLAASRLQRLAYVSTAYVAGMRTGVVYEHELVMGQAFKNHYESTKFQAEVWVREAMDRVPTTILRPAIVVGDSRTGETEKFDGPYYLLRAIARSAQLRQPVVQFGAARAPFNVVPVDYVVEALLAAGGASETVDETLHLVDPEPLATSELLSTLSREYAHRAPRGRVSPRMMESVLRSRAVRDLFGGTPRESVAYLNHPVTFDTRRAVDLLAPHGLVPPHFTDYVDAMVRFFREHEHDPAFAPKRD